MRKTLGRIAAAITGVGLGASPLLAHPETTPHSHAGELIGLAVLAVALLALLAPGRRRPRRT